MKTVDRIRSINRYYILVSIVSIFMFIIFFAIDWLTGTQYAQAFLPEFVAGALGVMFGFLIAVNREVGGKMDRVPEVLGILKQELEHMRIKSQSLDPNPLSTQAWSAFVNSGDASLIPFKTQRKLFEIYRLALELDIGRETEREARSSHMRTMEKKTLSYQNRISGQNQHLAHSLNQEIQKILQSNVFIP